jgi:hypothetical protein
MCRAGLRTDAAIEPDDCRRDRTPLGFNRCSTGREQCCESSAVCTTQADLGATRAAEAMANDNGCGGRELE